MRTQITKIGDFKGVKQTLTHITVRKYIDSNNTLQYIIFKGAGSGSQIAMTSNYNAVKSFDLNFKSLKFKTIFSDLDDKMGGAWMLANEIFFLDHPFITTGWHF